MAKPHPADQSCDRSCDSGTEAFADAVREGLADADAGQVVPYEKVRRWLLSWGTDRELPPPA
ncbi:CopG family transcriptional regulator [Azospirillum thermophilum]|uniref:CopG family transcriptional regulator n=1 Tax=Azospirillum thermophilum TaxID=2202148 RepID=A0A2S2CSA7_9PROT|nr:CopG family transcriptional regulator [Azospirillum thermophilum]AWK87394.1 CopG family transcriptional regulator [Azospirillum thermophilum]